MLTIHFSSSGGSSSGSGDTETCSEEGGEEEEEEGEEDLGNQNGVEDLSKEVVDTRELVVTGMEERLSASREKFVREEVHHLVNEGSPPYYRGARGMP